MPRRLVLLLLAAAMAACNSPLDRLQTHYWEWPEGFAESDYLYHDRECRKATVPYVPCMERLGYREISREAYEARRARKPG